MAATGYMAEPGNSDQLGEAILKLWSDQEAYQRMCVQGPRADRGAIRQAKTV